MYPVNQVIMGDPMMEARMEKMEEYRRRLNGISPVWNEIDAIVSSFTAEQRQKLLRNEEYGRLNAEIQELVQIELVNLVKTKIESSSEGEKLLKEQLTVVKKLRTVIVEETDREMDMFNRFREYSRQHPETTYDEFIKAQ